MKLIHFILIGLLSMGCTSVSSKRTIASVGLCKDVVNYIAEASGDLDIFVSGKKWGRMRLERPEFGENSVVYEFHYSIDEYEPAREVSPLVLLHERVGRCELLVPISHEDGEEHAISWRDGALFLEKGAIFPESVLRQRK